MHDIHFVIQLISSAEVVFYANIATYPGIGTSPVDEMFLKRLKL